MPVKSEQLRQELIEHIIDKIQQQYPSENTQLIAIFAKKYYSYVAYEDLQHKNIDDLCAMLISHWNFIYDRAPGEARVRVFNPQFECDGWQSKHTVIQISHDNAPFIVDSIRTHINRLGLLINLTIHTGGINVLRDEDNHIVKIFADFVSDKNVSTEAPVFLEIDYVAEDGELKSLTNSIKQILHDVKVVVEDWSKMRGRIDDLLNLLNENPPPLDAAEIVESKDFLLWLLQDNFIFLGCRDYRLIVRKGKRFLQAVPDSGYGVLRKKRHKKPSTDFSALLPEVEKLILSPQILLFAKTNTLSTVHRDAYTDYVGVKRFNKDGYLIGETRFVGLYSSETSKINPENIPLLRHKVGRVLQNSKLNLLGYAGKSLRAILDALPRDDLLQASPDELLELSLGILHLQEHQRVCLFVRKDVYNRYFSCMVYIPRDRFNTEIFHEIQDELQQSLRGVSVTFSLSFSSSALVRIHFMVRINSGDIFDYNVNLIEQRIVQITRSWADDFKDALNSYYGSSTALLYADRYKNAFPASYRERFAATTAVLDIKNIESLSDTNDLNLYFYRSVDSHNHPVLHLKLFRRSHTIALSNVLPMLENMGLRVIDECPHRIILKDKTVVWLNDFEMFYLGGQEIDVEKIRPIFQEAFSAVWHGHAEDDSFNRLVLLKQLSWREVTVLRAYAKYLRQLGFTFSQKYIEETLNENFKIAKYLIDLFNIKFDPDIYFGGAVVSVKSSAEVIESQINKALDEVTSLDQDRILRRYLAVIKATLRVNYFQKDKAGRSKNYYSFKFNSALIPDMPKPYPKYEIFVYSTDFEGIHLRAAKVARGGIRWSDRKEDFRTEILGLMKAQQVKNAVIVPHGAKGGFVVKNLPKDADRDSIFENGVRCYSNFIKGMLDITDNLQEKKLIHPIDTVCYDDADPYLVVAADKGTATFSDIANNISIKYNFWLGDAFASGGSVGYDHKKIGITARGAWESVQRHFRELGHDTQSEDFTVVGIGDMAGDVFGNGMLLSRHIRLVAAFNHQHIFIDPNPNAAKSFVERQRLFNLPCSSWADYDLQEISRGGGVFPRSAKYIQLSQEIKQLLGISKDFVVPNDLLNAILKLDVDLLFNGGIGTFVKATTETHADAGDRANDAIRIDANELRCKVISEGGNLGLTQLARIEYALSGGRIYTDFIDNSAGVDCSDHEVNIKILLNGIMAQNEITYRQRNKILHENTQQVANLVLADNYRQTQAISLDLFDSTQRLDQFAHFIAELEQLGRIDRELEYLPNNQELSQRKVDGKGLTPPELAILLAYSKIVLKEEILASNLPENPILQKLLLFEFPLLLRTKYYLHMLTHSLSREIVATQLCNCIVNEMGSVFIYGLQEESGASVAEIIKAYVISKTIFNKDQLWEQIERLDLIVEVNVQLAMLKKISHLIDRSTRWFLHNRAGKLDIEKIAEQFANPVATLERNIPKLITETDKANLDKEIAEFINQGVPGYIAESVVYCSTLLLALDIVQASLDSGFSIKSVASAYFILGSKLDLNWFRTMILSYQAETQWDVLACVKFYDDLDLIQRKLTVAALTAPARGKSVHGRVGNWLEQNQNSLKRWRAIVANIRASTTVEPIMFSVGLRELLDII